MRDEDRQVRAPVEVEGRDHVPFGGGQEDVLGGVDVAGLGRGLEHQARDLPAHGFALVFLCLLRGEKGVERAALPVFVGGGGLVVR